jgi:hypothetical protein
MQWACPSNRLDVLGRRLKIPVSTSGSRRRLERSTPGDGRHLYRLAARGSQPYDCRKPGREYASATGGWRQ